jgi:hypothetical protein
LKDQEETIITSGVGTLGSCMSSCAISRIIIHILAVTYFIYLTLFDSVTMHCILYISYYNFHIGILKKNISVAGIL